VRLEVSRKTDLAARSCIELALARNRVKAPVLADRIGTTPGFLAQVMAPLVRRGWVRSEPGPLGGYSLSVALDDLSVLDVVEGVEGPTDAGRCVLRDQACGGAEPCALHGAWAMARERLVDELASVPLSTLLPAAADVAPEDEE
jgi:Rrf2 family protein